jgi:hypothetical protein
MNAIDRIKRAAALTLRAVEFGFYHLLLTTVDRVSHLPRNTTMPEAARLYRENIALKAQLDAAYRRERGHVEGEGWSEGAEEER